MFSNFFLYPIDPPTPFQSLFGFFEFFLFTWPLRRGLLYSAIYPHLKDNSDLVVHCTDIQSKGSHMYTTNDDDFGLKKMSLVSGKFGSGVTSLFIFTRWLLLLNLFLSILWSALVILPQAVNYDYDQVNDDFYMHNLLDGQVSDWVMLRTIVKIPYVVVLGMVRLGKL